MATYKTSDLLKLLTQIISEGYESVSYTHLCIRGLTRWIYHLHIITLIEVLNHARRECFSLVIVLPAFRVFIAGSAPRRS